MIQVIDFFFLIWSKFFQVIVSSWIMSMMFLIGILGMVITLVNNSQSDNK